MNRKLLAGIAALVLLIPWLASPIGGQGASVGASRAGARATAPQRASLPTPPNVTDRAHARAYKGQSITYFGDSVGISHQIDEAMATKFQKQTGIKVKVIAHPQSTTDLLAQLQRTLTSHSSSLDVMMIDVTYPGTFAPYLLNLKPYMAAQAKRSYSSIVANDTVKGKLVGIPYFADFGLLYYRKDLLRKYGYSRPPKTWEQLTKMATKIQAGQRKTNKHFYGFVFQGNAYEGLTCNALEWIASFGGGDIINNGRVTLDNPHAIKALKLAQSWIGTISPRGVTSYEESDSQGVFDAGDAAFVRQWPYVYALSTVSGSKVRGKFGVAQLPHGPGGRSSATVGGWQLAINKYSKHQAASIEWAKYLTQASVQAWRAVVGTYTPAQPGVAAYKRVRKAEPFLSIQTNRVTRPSSFLGPKYNQGSTYFFQGVNEILNGQNVSAILEQMKLQLGRLLSR